MKKNIWGLCFVILGIIFALNAFELTNIDIFFKGWWTLFIIVPALIDLFGTKSNNKTANLILIILGILLLLANQNIVSFNMIYKLFGPLILIIIGLSMLFNEQIKKGVTNKIRKNLSGEYETLTATFSENRINKEGLFEKINLDAVFGSIYLNLNKAQIKKEAVIKCSSVFAGIEIIVPENTNVEGGVGSIKINFK